MIADACVRLLPAGPHGELDLRDPCGIRGGPADVELSDYQVLVNVCTSTWYVGTVYELKLLFVTASPSFK